MIARSRAVERIRLLAGAFGFVKIMTAATADDASGHRADFWHQ